MSLENTFGKVEKPAEEKKLEVITTKEATIKDLGDYFEKNKYEDEEYKDWDESKEYFSSCMNFLKSFELTPEIISEFNTKIGSVKEKEALGTYLSAMIQSSYNQGFNNFVFGEVYANHFGALLKGKPENPIRITAKNVEGGNILSYAQNCSLTVKMLKGKSSLYYAKDCLAEITNYLGSYFGGWSMENCTIKSKNKETLEMIKEQITQAINKYSSNTARNNKFELTK